MRFTVPQFIEHEAKIIGPLTFKQFIYIGVAGAICFVLYFTIGQQNLFLFLLTSAILIGGAFTLAFVKIEGRSIPELLLSFLKFTIAQKIFIWKKTEVPIKVLKKEEGRKKKNDELPLKIAEKSQLKKIKRNIETKTK